MKVEYRAWYRFDDDPADEIGTFDTAEEAAEAIRREYPYRAGDATIEDLFAGVYVSPGWVWIEKIGYAS